MNKRIEVTPKQAIAVVTALTATRDSAAGCAARLAMAGLGETALWLRLDALEVEFAELLDGLQPTLFLEQSKSMAGAVISTGVADDNGGKCAILQAVADGGHE